MAGLRVEARLIAAPCGRRTLVESQRHRGDGLPSKTTILAIAALPVGLIGYVVSAAVLDGLGAPDFLILIVPLFVAGLCAVPLIIPFFDRMAKRDLAAHRAQQAAEDDGSRTDSGTPGG